MPPEDKHKVSIIPLGGFEEVGRNMLMIESDEDILLIECGLMFPDEDMPGIDYIIPDTSYLRGKENKIKGLIITHAHYDHIGAIPHVLPRIGNPIIYTTLLTANIIRKRQEDFPNLPKLKIIPIEPKIPFKIGNFLVEAFHVNHNVPGGIGVVVRTKAGNILYTGDFKFDFNPINDKPADIAHIAQLGASGIHMMISDSTGAETPGHSLSESTIGKNLEEIIKAAPGRVFATTFSSLLNRIQQVLAIAEKYGRKVVVEGYSMRTNIEIALRMGILKAKKDTFISAEKSYNYPPHKIIVLCTGAQGEDKAVLMRIANREHKTLKVHKGDLVIFSSSVVPGNERTVQNLKDLLYREGARVIHYQMMDVHAGGHAQQEDLKMMIRLVNPQYFVPGHGNFYLRRLHADLAIYLGIPENRILLPDNGEVVDLVNGKAKITKKKVPANHVMVDGLGVGDVGQVVLRDRQILAKDGMVVIIAQIDKKGKLVDEPDIISRGFIYMKGSAELVNAIKEKVEKIITQPEKKDRPQASPTWSYLRAKLRDDIGQFLYTKTERRPMILPVIIEV